MFTGLVQLLGAVAEVRSEPPGKRLIIRAPSLATAKLGASIAVSGCCLTVVTADPDAGLLHFEAGEETLSKTTLGELNPGSAVNLEASLCLGDELGGHFVTGHVDGVGALDERRDDGPWSYMWFSAPAHLIEQMAPKGSAAVDGVSLTLVDVESHRFSVALIPHTLSVTSLGRLQLGSRVNLETDLLAKYVQRQLRTRS